MHVNFPINNELSSEKRQFEKILKITTIFPFFFYASTAIRLLFARFYDSM